jgi:hypothetical protein
LTTKYFPFLLFSLLLVFQPAMAAEKPRIMFWSWFSQEDFSQIGSHYEAKANVLLPSPTGDKSSSNSAILSAAHKAPFNCQMPSTGEAIGVAMLCGKIHLARRGEDATTIPKLTVIPRLNGLTLGNRYCEGVVRLEIEEANPSCQPELIEALVQRTLALVFKNRRMDGIQIDFDARVSQRKFYTCYLRALKSALPEGMPLSITALASWAMGDNWLTAANLPVDEVVPMFFSMGSGGDAIKNEITKGRRPLAFKGRHCLGLRSGEMQEMLPLLETGPNYSVDRVYLFASHGWQVKNAQEALKLVEQTLARGKK